MSAESHTRIGPATVILAAGIPVAVAVAVFCHRLYDIDLVISRSLVVAGVGTLGRAREQPYGKRATPNEVLPALSRQAAPTPDESSLGDIAELLAEGTGAGRVTTVQGVIPVRRAARVTA